MEKVVVPQYFEPESPLWVTILDAVRTTARDGKARWDEALEYMAEGLTFSQYEEIKGFFKWMEQGNRAMGHGNYFTQYFDYKLENDKKGHDQGA